VPAPPPPVLPDVSHRSLDQDLLQRLVDDPSAALLTNEMLVAASAADPGDEAADHERFGRRTGIATDAWGAIDGASVRIDVLADAEGATRFLADRIEDLAKRVEGSGGDGTLTTFATDPVGDETSGFVLEDASGSTTTVAVRLGRIVAWASMDRPGDARVPAQYLAREVVDHVTAVLVDAPAPAATPALPAYAFATERIVVGDDRVAFGSEGTIDGDDVACTITVDGAVTELRRVGDVVWERRGDDLVRVGGPATAQRALLARCPSWPLDARVSGLNLAVGPEPAVYVLDGVRVLGHRGDADDLGAVLDVDPAGLDVEVFNVWLAEDSPWLVELDLVVGGPASVLEPLTGVAGDPDDRVTVTVRHRVTELGQAPPVLPPQAGSSTS
ncbi:MAG: hypothetical protein R3290_00895, partial [Acidimicrobiia bacterium]|nr:hypothetical protein [Acidimicrobiia bacterium]